MKFGQFIECNMTNIFLEKSYTKCSEQISRRPLSEKKKIFMIFMIFKGLSIIANNIFLEGQSPTLKEGQPKFKLYQNYLVLT